MKAMIEPIPGNYTHLYPNEDKPSPKLMPENYAEKLFFYIICDFCIICVKHLGIVSLLGAIKCILKFGIRETNMGNIPGAKEMH